MSGSPCITYSLSHTTYVETKNELLQHWQIRSGGGRRGWGAPVICAPSQSHSAQNMMNAPLEDPGGAEVGGGARGPYPRLSKNKS